MVEGEGMREAGQAVREGGVSDVSDEGIAPAGKPTGAVREGDLNASEDARRPLYAAFAAGDVRFDGQIFMGVTSTGIYCRPVCSARLPKFENCRFFRTPAEAEAAGFRPCLTCRPEAAPGLAPVDARASLARRAADLLREECASRDGLSRLAARLGYTDRHLRRAFEEEYHVTPTQYLQTCRLLTAKSLLTDSGLSVSQVARAAGFGSVRRFNQLFRERYHLTPTDLRKRRGAAPAMTETVTVRLGYRPPYRFDKLLEFFRVRALEGVERVDGKAYARTVRIILPSGKEARGWIRVTDDAARQALVVTISESLIECVPQVCARIRRQFDLDSDPQAVYEGIRSLDEIVPGAAVPGTRVPGCFDSFETACRAVLGQQVTVAAASRFAARIVAAYGAPVDTGEEGLTRAFPLPAEVLALEDAESALGALGVIKSRTRTIVEIARLIEAGELLLGPGAVVEEQVHRLLAIRGIGPWSANYLAMRTLSHPDAFMETDSGVAHALPDLSPRERAALAERWRPWRSYANLCLWNSLSDES